MEKSLDRLSAALKEIAREDAAAAPRYLDARFVGELRLRRAAAATPGRLIGFGIAASLAAAVVGALGLVTRLPRLGEGPSFDARSSTGRIEITTSFIPLIYSTVPYTDAQIVRLEVPRSALTHFGLAPAEIPADVVSAVSQTTVLADVLVGEDGLARAVRFVRAGRAPGVAP